MRWELAAGTAFGLLGLRYNYVWLSMPALSGDQRFGLHGVYAELGFAFTEVLKGNLRHLERATGVEIALPVGVLVDPGGKVAFSAGMASRFLIPL